MTYTTAHNTAWSLTHWVRPGIEHASLRYLVVFLSTTPQWEFLMTVFVILSFLHLPLPNVLFFLFHFSLHLPLPVCFVQRTACLQRGCLSFGISVHRQIWALPACRFTVGTWNGKGRGRVLNKGWEGEGAFVPGQLPSSWLAFDSHRRGWSVCVPGQASHAVVTITAVALTWHLCPGPYIIVVSWATALTHEAAEEGSSSEVRVLTTF